MRLSRDVERARLSCPV